MFLPIFALIILVAQSAFAGYSQWIELTIKNSCSEALHVTGGLDWGKWYKNGDNSQETSGPNNLIQPGEKLRVSACGRADSASGTQGTIRIWDSDRNKQLVTAYFNCPWSGSNDFRALVHETSYVAVSHSSFTAGGALGEMSMRVVCG